MKFNKLFKHKDVALLLSKEDKMHVEMANRTRKIILALKNILDNKFPANSNSIKKTKYTKILNMMKDFQQFTRNKLTTKLRLELPEIADNEAELRRFDECSKKNQKNYQKDKISLTSHSFIHSTNAGIDAGDVSGLKRALLELLEKYETFERSLLNKYNPEEESTVLLLENV